MQQTMSTLGRKFILKLLDSMFQTVIIRISDRCGVPICRCSTYGNRSF
jgi:hypothetical protein